MMRIDGGFAAVSTRLEQALPQLAPATALARQCRPQAATTGIDEAELDRTLAEADAILALGPTLPPIAPAPPSPDGYSPTDEQIAHYDRELVQREDLARRLELALCVLRTFLARCRRSGLTAALDEAETGQLTAALSHHLAHRREEHRLAVQRTEDEAEDWRRRGPGWESFAATAAQRAAALKALDDDSLLCDRHCLH